MVKVEKFLNELQKYKDYEVEDIQYNLDDGYYIRVSRHTKNTGDRKILLITKD